jgi:hypothetical protein
VAVGRGGEKRRKAVLNRKASLSNVRGWGKEGEEDNILNRQPQIFTDQC